MSQYGPPGPPYGTPPGGGSGQSRDPWPGGGDEETYGQPVDPWADQDLWGGAPTSIPPAGSGESTGLPTAPTPVSPGYPPAGGQGHPGSGHPGSGHAGSGHPVSPGGYSGGYPPPGPPVPQPGATLVNPPVGPYVPGQPPAGPAPSWSTIAAPPPNRGGRKGVALLVALAILILGGGTVAILVNAADDPGGHKGNPGWTASAGPTATEPDDTATPEPETTTPEPESSTSARFVKEGQCVRNEGTEEEPSLVIADCAPETLKVLRRIDGPTSGKADAEKKCAKVAGYTYWYFFDSPLDAFDYVLCMKSV